MTAGDVTGSARPATPAAGGAAVRAWWASLRRSRPPWHLVPDHELPRLERLRQARDRDASALALALVRLAAAEEVGCRVDAVQVHRRCPRCGSSGHGPLTLAAPDLPGLALPHVSVSHSGDVVVVALCAHAPVGVDVEAVPDVDLGDDVLAAVLPPGRLPEVLRATPRERCEVFTGCWTRAEAVLKALGVGLVVPLSAVDLVEGRLWRPGPQVPLVPAGTAARGVGVTATTAPPGSRAAVAVVGAHPVPVHHDARALIRRGPPRPAPAGGAPPGRPRRPGPARTGG